MLWLTSVSYSNQRQTFEDFILKALRIISYFLRSAYFKNVKNKVIFFINFS